MRHASDIRLQAQHNVTLQVVHSNSCAVHDAVRVMHCALIIVLTIGYD